MLATGRKVSGRGEAVEANYAFGPLEDDVIAKAFLQELNTFEIPLLKSKALVDANLREKHNFDELRGEVNRQIVQAKIDIEMLKKQLQESRSKDGIRRSEIAALDAENTASSQTLELRKKQFALFLHVVDELQNTIEEEQRSLIEEKEQKTAGGSEPMHKWARKRVSTLTESGWATGRERGRFCVMAWDIGKLRIAISLRLRQSAILRTQKRETCLGRTSIKFAIELGVLRFSML
ncbi:unnamed protein product [Malus baccata var. baccata]